MIINGVCSGYLLLLLFHSNCYPYSGLCRDPFLYLYPNGMMVVEACVYPFDILYFPVAA